MLRRAMCKHCMCKGSMHLPPLHAHVIVKSIGARSWILRDYGILRGPGLLPRGVVVSRCVCNSMLVRLQVPARGSRRAAGVRVITESSDHSEISEGVFFSGTQLRDRPLNLPLQHSHRFAVAIPGPDPGRTQPPAPIATQRTRPSTQRGLEVPWPYRPITTPPAHASPPRARQEPPGVCHICL
jgi:hypothetical protein